MGTERGFAQKIKAPTHPSRLLPALPTRSSAGLVLGCRPHLRGRRGAQHIPPQQRQHLFIAAPGPPRHGRRSEVINAETRGVNWAPTPWRGLVSPGAVPCGGSGVRGGGTGPGTGAGITPRGRRRDNGALCRRYHRGWEAEAAKQGAAGWHDAVPAGTATAGDSRATATGAAGAGRCCRAAAARPGGIPASGKRWAPAGDTVAPVASALSALGWLVPVATAGGDRRWMALAVSLSHDPEAGSAAGWVRRPRPAWGHCRVTTAVPCPRWMCTAAR